jgi:hypothetical protein
MVARLGPARYRTEGGTKAMMAAPCTQMCARLLTGQSSGPAGLQAAPPQVSTVWLCIESNETSAVVMSAGFIHQQPLDPAAAVQIQNDSLAPMHAAACECLHRCTAPAVRTSCTSPTWLRQQHCQQAAAKGSVLLCNLMPQAAPTHPQPSWQPL